MLKQELRKGFAERVVVDEGRTRCEKGRLLLSGLVGTLQVWGGAPWVRENGALGEDDGFTQRTGTFFWFIFFIEGACVWSFKKKGLMWYWVRGFVLLR